MTSSLKEKQKERKKGIGNCERRKKKKEYM